MKSGSAFKDLAHGCRFLILCAPCVLCLVLFPGLAAAQVQTVPSTYFGMHMTTGVVTSEPWPADPFGTMRLWDTGTSWAEINTAHGVYDWSEFDLWLQTAQAHGVTDVLYTFGATPTWASSNPSDPNCRTGEGQCDPPNDLNADGSGTDQHWKDFVTAVAIHAAGQVKYWEIWNEANLLIRWTGTMSQLLRMSLDARSIIRSIDPSALILSPSVSNGISGNAQWIGQYLSRGGVNYVDVVTFHGYLQQPGKPPVAEDIVTMVDDIKLTMQQYGALAKPLWNTEGSWGDTGPTGFTDLDQQAAFTARYLLLQWSAHTQRVYWFEWNSSEQHGADGTLWEPSRQDPHAPGLLLEPGVAYGQLYKWMVGAQMPKACFKAGKGTWFCELTRPGGYSAWAVWNCTQPISYFIPPKFTYVRDLLGNEIPAPGSRTLTTGCKPLLLETAPLP